MQPKKRGRPATGQGVPVQVRLQAEQLGRLDRWIGTQPDLPSRAEAIRRLVEKGLEG